MTISPDARTAEARLGNLHQSLGGIAYGGDCNPEQWGHEVRRPALRVEGTVLNAPLEAECPSAGLRAELDGPHGVQVRRRAGHGESATHDTTR